ncbi:MAG: hypothetical protein K2M91_07325 [Lachnospiraceae bacterium]|nr:hypothetical protein [Lachnospiraceae bacterium]
MKIIREGTFTIDYIEYGGDGENHNYDGEQLTPEFIAEIKQGIAEGKIQYVSAMSVEGAEGDAFCIEYDIGDQEREWMDISITFTDAEGIEHSFLYYNEKYAQENEEDEESIAFDQDIRWISSLCNDFELAAKIFEKWILTGTLYSRPWRHQWADDNGDNYEIYGLE